MPFHMLQDDLVVELVGYYCVDSGSLDFSGVYKYNFRMYNIRIHNYIVPHLHNVHTFHHPYSLKNNVLRFVLRKKTRARYFSLLFFNSLASSWCLHHKTPFRDTSVEYCSKGSAVSGAVTPPAGPGARSSVGSFGPA